MPENIKATFQMIVAAFCFGLLGIFSRFSGENPFVISFYRAILAAGFFLIINLYKKKNFKFLIPERKALVCLLFYGTSMALTSLLFVSAYSYTSMAHTVIFHYTMPIFVMVLSGRILNEKIENITILAFILGFLGIGLITGANIYQKVSKGVIIGDSFALISAITFAGVILSIRWARKQNIGIGYFMFWGWLIAAIVCFLFNSIWGHFIISLKPLLYIIAIAIISTILPSVLYNIAMRHLTAQVVSIISYSEIVFVILFGMIIFNEKLSMIDILGVLFIISGILAVSFTQLKRKLTP